MLQDRVDAERMYASRLHKIGTRAQQPGAFGNKNPSATPIGISFGKLGDEVQAFRMDRVAKARQAEELAANVQSDCIDMLKTMLSTQEEKAWKVFTEAKLLIGKLEEDVSARVVKGAAA